MKARPYRMKQIAGLRFGRLVALRFHGKNPGGETLWLCKCDCGKRCKVQIGNLTSRHTTSCGCFNLEQVRKIKTIHGLTDSNEHGIWATMLSRCYNSKTTAYRYYGALGVTVCDRWHDFTKFLQDMGPRPTRHHSLDRYPDPNGNYGLGNCRWATHMEQANNRRRHFIISAFGKTQNLSLWCAELGLNYKTVWGRLKYRGVRPETALQNMFKNERTRS